tara:strand:+ start:575 stop:958 length:384 start_codon:yes stop_codon:yes gene_type:complete
MSIQTQSNQTPVPDSRVWRLERTADKGLVATGPAKSLQTSETLLFAFDFSHDTVGGSVVSSISSVAVEGGTTQVTFDADAQGIDRHLVKVEITGATATTSPIGIRCRVVYSDGSTAEGDGRLSVVAA